MNYQELKQALKITDGKITISHRTLGSTVSDFLTAYYNNKPIVITGAEPGSGDGENETVVISGKSSFLNVANAPVTASFSLDNKGNVKGVTRLFITFKGDTVPKSYKKSCDANYIDIGRLDESLTHTNTIQLLKGRRK